MAAPDAELTLDAARALLGLSHHAGTEEARRAFRAAAKLAHPDRPGGDAAQFRKIVAAYRALQSSPSLPAIAPPRIVEPHVEIDVLIALGGGEAEAVLADGRRIRTRIPPGARHGERLRIAGGFKVAVRIAGDETMLVRGSDVWVTAILPAALLDQGGRAVVQTPVGARTLWITSKAGGRGLVRLPAKGLPARAAFPQGDLYIRLIPEGGTAEGPARAQLRKFAAAWAA